MPDRFGPARDKAMLQFIERHRKTIEKMIVPTEFELVTDRHGRSVVRLSLFVDEEFIEEMGQARLKVSIEQEGEVTHG